uniref:Metaxin glutathione S-transferase domain-containing protein n=1 Tax=Acrobeloides nanus TaxID=290746 RepID=A0A914DDY4_9BILA
MSRMMDRLIDGSIFNAAHISKFRADLIAFCGVLLESAPMSHILKYPMAFYARPYIMDRFWIQGSARYSKEELLEILRRDFKAIASILGDKNFVFEDKPHEIDCTLFGHMASFTYLPFEHDAKTILLKEFPTITNHMERMGKMFFSEFKFRK